MEQKIEAVTFKSALRTVIYSLTTLFAVVAGALISAEYSVKSFFPCKNEKWLGCIFFRNKFIIVTIFPTKQTSHVS